MDYSMLQNAKIDVSEEREVVITHEGDGYVRFKVQNKRNGLRTPDFKDCPQYLDKALLSYANLCPNYRPNCQMYVTRDTALFYFELVD